MQKRLFIILLLFFNLVTKAENGYQLWLRYAPVGDSVLAASYANVLQSVFIGDNSKTMQAIKNEIKLASHGMLSVEPDFIEQANAQLLIGTNEQLGNLLSQKELSALNLGDEGFLIKTINHKMVVTANTEIGVLYGTFRLLSLMQQGEVINPVNLVSVPKLQKRVLNHWDNLDRTVERGYAGFSIFDWHKLPDYIDPRYIDYARANASIGINGTVVTNVNANALVLTGLYLQKLAALADAFRPYGIQVYLTARFSAPIEIGGLETADPLNKEVQNWWAAKAKEIYQLIPDFGGFLVKANSEGQPGPQDYNRTHADGANMLADAVATYGGIIMWRAFVYSHEAPDDRAKQAYNEFKPLDGEFRPNVLVQVKNGAIDFQPREPFHPLFGAMPKTPLMLELQITQEYTGCATHLFYQAPLYKETLESDTYCSGTGSTVAKIIDGSMSGYKVTGIAGVANIGNEINWTGHPFAQANWYAFGRLAWNHDLTSEEIAQEWLKMTFSQNERLVETATNMMIASRENLVNYMTPLGLHHMMAWNHHYGPGPWVNIGRADWTSVYYHKADEFGIGFDRSSTGSNAVAQYFPEVCHLFNDVETCPEQYILWFHHLSWNQKMSSGRTLWNELCYRYYSGAAAVVTQQKQWETLKPFIDEERFVHVQALLKIQANEAVWWRNACLLYFQQFSKQPIPVEYEQPEYTLDYYEQIINHFVPGIKNE